jgi:hypothetical protein
MATEATGLSLDDLLAELGFETTPGSPEAKSHDFWRTSLRNT